MIVQFLNLKKVEICLSILVLIIRLGSNHKYQVSKINNCLFELIWTCLVMLKKKWKLNLDDKKYLKLIENLINYTFKIVISFYEEKGILIEVEKVKF